MKKIILALLCCCIAEQAMTQQPTELLLDEVAYEKMPSMADFNWFGSKYEETPLEYSLKPFCPEPNFQNGVPNSVFQSLSYAAMTIMYAAQNNITDKLVINQIKFSVLYGFNQVATACKAIGFRPAFEFLKNHGTVLFSDFDQQKETDCQTKPKEGMAITYKIKDYTRVLNPKYDRAQKIRAIKQCIATQTPVIAAMRFPASILSYKGEKPYYDDPNAPDLAHAMVVIGYDEYSFELINSYGKDWGKKGYVKIKYVDFFKYLKECYQIAFDAPILTPTKIPTLQGHFECKTPQEGVMKPIAFTLKSGRYYQSVEKMSVNQQFQMAAIDLQKNKYVYVFSYDPDGKINWHWPKADAHQDHSSLRESALTPYETTSFVLPGDKRAFTKDKVGTDYLFVLYSDKALVMNDLENRLKIMERSTVKTVGGKFEAAFEGLLLDWQKIKYDTDKVGFTAPITDAIVPLILQIKGE
jgi:hypothetical protein